MPQVSQNKEYRTFVQGLVTDTSPLSFPENASKDEDNFKLNLKGYRSRRLGIDLEESAETTTITDYTEAEAGELAVTTHVWKNPDNISTIELVAIQYGNKLIIAKTNVTPIDFLYTVTLTRANSSVRWKSTTVNGDLLLATGDHLIYRVSYIDGIVPQVDVEAHGLLVRDIWGVDDGHSDDDRFVYPTDDVEMGDKRLYNLLNQGWANKLDTKTSYPVVYDFIEDNKSGSSTPWPGRIPGGSTVSGLYMWPNNNMSPVGAWAVTPPNADEDNIQALPKSSSIPKGHYILDFFYKGISRQLVSSGQTLLDNLKVASGWDSGIGISGSLSELVFYVMTNSERIYLLDTTETDDFTSWLTSGLGTSDLLDDGVPSTDNTGGVNAVANYASRVFYSGFTSALEDTDNKSLDIGNVILFSQVVDSPDKIGKCYQEGDPTSHVDFDLVDSDGGLIVVQGMGKVLKMVVLGEYLIVLATNGIWAISGGDTAFSATNYIVTKISETSIVSGESVVVANDAVYFWSDNGIYTIYADKSTLDVKLQSITDRKISNYYRALPQFSKTYCKGSYDKQDNTVKWVYNDTAGYDGTNWRFEYNRQLNFNIDLGAFYTYTFGSIDAGANRSPAVASIFTPPSVNVSSGTADVYSNGELVESNGEDVETTVFTATANLATTKYLVVSQNSSSSFSLRFCELNNTSFLDWEGYDSTGVDAPGYLITGQELLGDTQRDKQAVYLTTHFQRTETGFDELNDYAAENPSSCLITPYWDFADNTVSGKIGTAFQAYRLNRWYVPADASDPFSYGQSVITTKNKLRGRGKALSLKFSTEAGKDCIIYGWGILFTGNTSP